MEAPERIKLEQLGWRLDALDEWRRQITEKVSRVEERVEELSRADQIADEVARRLERSRGLELTMWQKLGGLVIGALLAVETVRGVAF